MKKFILAHGAANSCLIPAFCAILALSCSQKGPPALSGNFFEPFPAEPDAAAATGGTYLLDVPANERIAVLFGYGYNDADFVSGVLEYFDSAFVSASGEPVIASLVFPDDFKIGNNSRISLLYDRLNSFALAGAVLVGSPENTHSALARLMDSQGRFPVVSIFSQDDQMGTEALSDWVIDFEAPKETEEEFAEGGAKPMVDNAAALIARAVYYVSLLDAPPEKNADLRVHAAQMFGEWQVLPFIDAETGMRPVNHFTITQEKQG